MNTLVNRSIVINSNNAEVMREQVRAYFHQTADLYESLFQSLNSDEAYYVKPIALRHPLIFIMAIPILFLSIN